MTSPSAEATEIEPTAEQGQQTGGESSGGSAASSSAVDSALGGAAPPAAVSPASAAAATEPKRRGRPPGSKTRNRNPKSPFKKNLGTEPPPAPPQTSLTAAAPAKSSEQQQESASSSSPGGELPPPVTEENKREMKGWYYGAVMLFGELMAAKRGLHWLYSPQQADQISDAAVGASSQYYHEIKTTAPLALLGIVVYNTTADKVRYDLAVKRGEKHPVFRVDEQQPQQPAPSDGAPQ